MEAHTKGAARSPILVDSTLLVGARILFFLLARRFLHSLSPTLRELQKPEVSLPTTQTRTRPRSASAMSGVSVRTTRSPVEPASPLPDTDEDTSPASSYPGSPGSARSLLPGASSPTPNSRGGPSSVEMQFLGAKLQPRVIQLSHSAPPPSAVGTKRVKRTARGLSRIARTLFAVCFAESLTLIAIVATHALGILHANARRVNFSVSLHILLALILLVVPLVQCLLCTYRSRRDSVSTKPSIASLSLTARVLISLIPFAIYVFLFTRIPPYITAVKPADDSWAEGWEGGGWLESSLGRVVVLGVVVIAGLSGIGAVVTAWDYLEQAAGTRRVVTDADVLQAERSLYRVRHDAQAKRDEIERIARNEPEPSGWMTRVFGTKVGQELSALNTELRTLEVMEADIARSVATLRARHKAQGFRATLKGTVYNILGYIFAIYCVARLLLCAASLLSPFATSTATTEPTKGNSNGDWISFVLALALSGLDADADVARWSRTISLLFTGALVVSSLAMVLRWLARVLRLTSRTVGAGFLLLTLGQLFAMYVISLLVQLRSSLPPSPAVPPGLPANATIPANRTEANSTDSLAASAVAVVAAAAASADDSLLRSLPDFRVFGRLFDAVFLLTALSTFVYRWIAAKVTDDGDLYEALGR
ncbi:hypothetical protein CC85DRAFT_134821 [Cutaneotrichosporon oleaginosum]|uniref:Abscisic acid G-protein coupled receptor-like domain-containing protein n=1 Tax=Cutaneotrichosporon oleaginosum TaxID=879819 RepID=A0A0J0XWJ2_9TREE|nr:uncharacterized protein CC85DRAFT_134821 [Cutaneotrichosporon oleaginosum]KLT45435.1 hypothetical protein CC85DRAFT_134821 [Cutaneotrichosporon oleaginosum]TXT14604.1 hypothetical protein COLE_00797 [Cutaneotrichosporon oleaginosum]